MHQPPDAGALPTVAAEVGGLRGARPVRSLPRSRSALPTPLRHLGDRLPPAVLASLLAVQLVAPGSWDSIAWLPISLGLLLGLPHGAVDHLVPAWVRARRTTLPVLAGLLVAYAGTAAFAFALLRRWPTPGLAVFLLASLLHFGVGEVQYDRLRSLLPRAGRSHVRTAVQILGWGGTTVVLPLSRWPDEVRPVLETLAPGSSRLLTPTTAACGLVIILLAAGLTIALALHERRVRSAVELSLLVTVFVTVSPLVAFAVYFGAWHATRHVVRLLATDPANGGDLAAGRLVGPLLRFARAAAWPTAASLLVLLALVTATYGRQELLAASLVLLAALTAPHMIMVAWLDRHADQPVGGGRR